MSEILAFGINFPRFGGIYKLESNNMFKTYRDFETKIGGKKYVLYIGVDGM